MKLQNDIINHSYCLDEKLVITYLFAKGSLHVFDYVEARRCKAMNPQHQLPPYPSEMFCEEIDYDNLSESDLKFYEFIQKTFDLKQICQTI